MRRRVLRALTLFVVMASLEKLKISVVSWNGDTDPRNFYMWCEHMDSMVRSTRGGLPLIELLDSKLKRDRSSVVATPSYLLEDPDFAPPRVYLACRSPQGLHLRVLLGAQPQIQAIPHLSLPLELALDLPVQQAQETLVT